MFNFNKWAQARIQEISLGGFSLLFSYPPFDFSLLLPPPIFRTRVGAQLAVKGGQSPTYPLPGYELSAASHPNQTPKISS